jgi:hypothetical protein
MTCRYCLSRHIRFSRLHLFDIPALLVLRIPVRCRSCQERAYVGILKGLKLAFTKKRVHRSSREKASADGQRNSAAA